MKKSELRQIIREEIELLSENKFSSTSGQKYFQKDIIDQTSVLINDLENWLDELNFEMGYDTAQKVLKDLKRQVSKLKLD